MNKFIKEQLERVKNIQLPEYDDDTLEIFIPRQVTTERSNVTKAEDISQLTINHRYQIKVDDSLVNPGNWYNTIHGNWNKGIGPKKSILNAEIVQFIGKMVKINSIDELGQPWEGFLPKGNITIIKEI